MSVIIFSTSIITKNGYTHSIINTANALSDKGLDVILINTLHGEFGGSLHCYSNDFKLSPSVKRFSIHNYPLKTDVDICATKSINKKISHPNMKLIIKESDVNILNKIASSFTKKDFVIFGNPLISEIFSENNISMECKSAAQIHCNIEKDLPNQQHLKNAHSYVDFVQIVAEEQRGFLVNTLGIKNEKIKCIYNIFDHSFKYTPKIKNRETLILGMIGWFSEVKNQMKSIEIAKDLVSRGIKFKFIYYGTKNGEYYEEFFNLIKSSNLENYCECRGFESSEKIYATIDILISLSTSEGFSYTLIEACYFGVPIISSDYNYGPKETIKNGHNGYIVKAGLVSEFSEKISELLDDKKYSNFSKNARSEYLEKFEKNKIVKKYVDLVEDTSFCNSNVLPIRFFSNHRKLKRFEYIDGKVLKFIINKPCTGKFSVLSLDSTGKLLKICDSFENAATIEFQGEIDSFKDTNLYMADAKNIFYYICDVSTKGIVRVLSEKNDIRVVPEIIFENKVLISPINDHILNIVDILGNTVKYSLNFAGYIDGEMREKISFEESYAKINILYQDYGNYSVEF